MMMYDEFVKELRDAENYAKEMCTNPYRFVPYYGKAADVIEVLSLIAESSDRRVAQWAETAIKAVDQIPCWIPVTEGLPKTQDSLLGKKSNKVIVAFRFSDGTQGTDTAHILNGEWVFEDHITVVERTITHWMPLPEPQKEEV